MNREGKNLVQAMKEEIAEAITNRVALAKRRDGINQVVIARQLGITQPRLSYLISGQLKQFSLDKLIEVAVDLGLNVGIEVKRPYKN